MDKDQAARPLYTTNQLEQYFDYISFPKDVRIKADATNTHEGLLFLTRLLKYQLSHVPFENLDLHYSSHHTVTLDTDHLFHKIVERQVGRGGYCMENNLFFGTVLRSLGYQVMCVGARVNSCIDATDDSKVDSARYDGFNHTLNIITVAGKKYLVDVGFGARGPTAPVPLEDGVMGRNTGNAEQGGTLFRLAREHIPDNTHANPEQLLWVYRIRFDERMGFIPTYCFTDIEFLPQDFNIINFYISQSRTTFFTQIIVVQQFLLDENEDVIGDVSLFGKAIKERKFGEARPLCEINSEADRVDALKKYFGISLAKPEINGIAGLVSQISS